MLSFKMMCQAALTNQIRDMHDQTMEQQYTAESLRDAQGR